MKEFDRHTDILMQGYMPFVEMVEIGHNVWVHPSYPRACLLTSFGFKPLGRGENKQHCIDMYIRKDEDKSELKKILKQIGHEMDFIRPKES